MCSLAFLLAVTGNTIGNTVLFALAGVATAGFTWQRTRAGMRRRHAFDAYAEREIARTKRPARSRRGEQDG